MFKQKILQLMYNISPMNFYTFDDDSTIIKSIHNSSKGYKFFHKFSSEDIDFVWKKIKLHRRVSAILIGLIFIFLLYEIVFPKFSFLVNNEWYINSIILLLLIAFVCQIITIICKKFFEKILSKKYGDFEVVRFSNQNILDQKYYKLFKFELVKVVAVLLIICTTFIFLSPFKIAKKLLDRQRYKDVIKVTTLGARLFPIAQEWYSLRGYANYKLGSYENAIHDFDLAFKLGADGFNIMNFDNKIFIKYTLKDYEGAIKDFDEQINSTDSDEIKDEFLWDKAQFLYNIEDYEKALDVYNKLIIRAESDRIFLLKDRLYLERAQVYKKLGQDDLAKQDIDNSQDFSGEITIPKPTLMLDEETFEE